jgi:hypothetical protein
VGEGGWRGVLSLLYHCLFVGLGHQIEVHGKFWDTNEGAVVTTTSVNKTQKRKHQINSLAFQASFRHAPCRPACPLALCLCRERCWDLYGRLQTSQGGCPLSLHVFPALMPDACCTALRAAGQANGGRSCQQEACGFEDQGPDVWSVRLVTSQPLGMRLAPTPRQPRPFAQLRASMNERENIFGSICVSRSQRVSCPWLQWPCPASVQLLPHPWLPRHLDCLLKHPRLQMSCHQSTQWLTLTQRDWSRELP